MALRIGASIANHRDPFLHHKIGCNLGCYNFAFLNSMGLTGNLKTMTPGDLLQWLSLSQKTGTLVVNSDSVMKKIFFRGGRIISSASNDPREYLGQFLMSHGFISEDELKKAMEVQAQSRILLGKILVTIGVITEPDLLRLMRLKAEEEIYDVFMWPEGDFRFIDDELPNMEMVPLQVEVTGILMEGTRRIDEWKRIGEVVSSQAMIPIIEKPLDLPALTEVQKTIVLAIDGKRPIGQIILESRSSYFNVADTLYRLVKAGNVQLLEPPEPETPLIEPFEEDSEEDEINLLLARAQTLMKGGDYEKALRILKAAQNLDPQHTKVKSAIKGAETVIVADLRRQGMSDSKIPELKKTLEEISSLNFTPNEGFVISRINGTWDIGSILKISPMRETDAMLIFHRLVKDGIVELK